MRSVSNWRSPRRADEYDKHDFAQFAQEYLCRNRDYCDQYDAIMRTYPRGSIILKQALEGLARQWGLSFPFRPRGRRPGRPSAVVAEPVGCDRHPRRSAERTRAATGDNTEPSAHAGQNGHSARRT